MLSEPPNSLILIITSVIQESEPLLQKKYYLSSIIRETCVIDSILLGILSFQKMELHVL